MIYDSSSPVNIYDYSTFNYFFLLECGRRSCLVEVASSREAMLQRTQKATFSESLSDYINNPVCEIQSQIMSHN